MPVRVFFPARLRPSSAPMNFRCFSDFAGMATSLKVEESHRGGKAGRLLAPHLGRQCRPLLGSTAVGGKELLKIVREVHRGRPAAVNLLPQRTEILVLHITEQPLEVAAAVRRLPKLALVAKVSSFGLLIEEVKKWAGHLDLLKSVVLLQVVQEPLLVSGSLFKQKTAYEI